MSRPAGRFHKNFITCGFVVFSIKGSEQSKNSYLGYIKKCVSANVTLKDWGKAEHFISSYFFSDSISLDGIQMYVLYNLKL